MHAHQDKYINNERIQAQAIIVWRYEVECSLITITTESVTIMVHKLNAWQIYKAISKKQI